MRPWTLVRRVFPFAVVVAVAVATLVYSPSLTPADRDVAAPPEPATLKERAVPSVEVGTSPQAEESSGTSEEKADEGHAGHTHADGALVAELDRTDVDPFSMVGVTWESGGSDFIVEVATHGEKGWSGFEELHADIQESNDTEAGRPGTEPLWVGEADGVAVRVLSPSGAEPADLKVATIDPGSTPDITPAAATVGQPKIISRSSWGASNGGSCDSPIYGSSTLGAVIHHTAGSNSYSKSQSAGIVKSTQAYHTGSRKWCDIGYNFLVDKYGQIFEGRKGGITKQVRAAHSGNGPVNERTMGVSMMGTFSSTNPSAAMKKAVADLVAWRFSKSKLKATGTYKIGGKTLNRIAGHRNVVGTECPGAKAYAWLSAKGGLRDSVADLLAGATATPDTAIQQLAASIGSAKLGALVRAEYGSDTHRRAVWKNMDILWTKSHGAHPIQGLVKKEFYRVGGHTGNLGYPRSTETTAATSVQRFEKGSVYHLSAQKAAYAIYGPIWDEYVDVVQNQSWSLGVPTSTIEDIGGGVERMTFSNGRIDLDTKSGTATAHQRTAIEKLAASIGSAKLGALVRAEYGSDTHRRAVWKNMDILSTKSHGAHPIQGLVKKEFYRLGGHTGKLGYPITTETSASASVQRFEHGAVYHWTQSGKKVAYGIYGKLWDAYRDAIQRKVPLGIPASAVFESRKGYERINLRNGYLELNTATGKVVVGGPAASAQPSTAIQKLADSVGSAKLGALVRAEYGSDTHRRAVWKNMDILWTKSHGAHPIQGLVKKEFYRLGGHTGKLGYPITTETSASASVQRFEHGAVYHWTQSGKKVAYGIYGPFWDAYLDAVNTKKIALGIPASSVSEVRDGVERITFRNGSIERDTSTGKITVNGPTTKPTPAPSPGANKLTVPSSGKVLFRGHGYGHGIGMSQYGAEGAARQGKTFKQILTTYYPGVKIEGGNTTIRVLLSTVTSSTVQVVPASGMVFRRPGVSGSTTLPTSVSGAKVTKWRITPIIADPKTSVLQYYAGGWKTYKNTKWVGDGEFAVVGGSVGLIQSNGKTAKYRNAVRSAVPSKGATSRKTVNVLSLDAYTLGVIAAEMPASWSAEALKAQAVAARTYARRSLTSSRYYDVCDTTACQVYRGVSSETSTTNAAGLATRGLIMTYQGSPVLSQYSSSNGGYSAPGSQPYLKAKSDPWDGWSGNKNHDWSVTITAAAIQKAFPSIGTLKSIEVLKRDGGGEWGGRVTSVKLVGSKKSQTITGPELRFGVGLKSAFFRLG